MYIPDIILRQIFDLKYLLPVCNLPFNFTFFFFFHKNASNLNTVKFIYILSFMTYALSVLF